MLVTTAMNKITRVRLLNVQYAANLRRNPISYGLFEAKGGTRKTSDLLMSLLAENAAAVGQDVPTGPLMHFHRRHLNYDTIIRMAKDPASGVSLTDEVRANC
ncbi:hypothetical protein PC118_g8537 [Phytophthora cactorum]|uniref:Uncharacterized protein n=1 Tax=Phytophthora cactorum TaxID=29920 RepID=A0A8T1E749_9STRA|nr:hypothetical protein PC114_g7701 [Phytophthora cactorum]KAG2949054.1 hypothetical protein PC117_g5550 [Phytophthora cactorum]KAG2985044.1 hypothetical protein PC118_g8537 [Phytophthora cactorum]KAG3017098.1 hypothetical protein PC120_g11218 [Phytophthora cactorum]KAG3038487.1 hypothetical protein PC119_g2838 [Phytophthora cactorum]